MVDAPAISTLRAWWHHRQGVDGHLAASPLHATIARTERFAREQLGDVRGSSVDSPASRAPRLAALRATSG